VIADSRHILCHHEKRWTVYSQRDLASAVGVDQSTVQQWIRAGFPRTKAGKNRFAYCIPCAVAWRLSGRDVKAEAVAALDDLMAGAGAGASPALERYRLARAIAAEWDNEQKKGSLVARDKVHDGLGRFASILRQFGERLGRRYGPDAARSVNDALDDCQRVVNDEFGDSGIHDSDP
jgi:phage terminase Nu1 subunit (DNA packaging protein)